MEKWGGPERARIEINWELATKRRLARDRETNGWTFFFFFFSIILFLLHSFIRSILIDVDEENKNILIDRISSPARSASRPLDRSRSAIDRDRWAWVSVFVNLIELLFAPVMYLSARASVLPQTNYAVIIVWGNSVIGLFFLTGDDKLLDRANDAVGFVWRCHLFDTSEAIFF